MQYVRQDHQGDWSRFDVPTDGVNFSLAVANRVWDSVGLAWVSEVQATGGGGGGGVVTQGTTPWITLDKDEAFRFDGSASPILYMGTAVAGTTDATSAWKIVKIDTTSGVSFTYAGGAATYSYAWTNRAGLSYS
jgi:hypothetical protein